MPKDKPLELVRIPLSQIKPDPKNAKDHDVGLIIESFRRFGYVNPMVLNSDDFLLAGHGRRKALLAMQGDNESPPKNIEAKDDEWIVPVGVGPDFDQREGTAYRLVDNRSTEVGGYDEPQLLENLIALSKNGGLEATGYDQEDIDQLFQLLNPNVRDVEISDEAEILREKWGVESGQLWSIGRHRLLCEDCINTEVVAELMQGEQAAAAITDPPYNVGYSSRGSNKDHWEIENDDMSEEDFAIWLHAVGLAIDEILKPGGAIYLCHRDTDRKSIPFIDLFSKMRWVRSSTIIWAKQAASMGWQDYRSQHECLSYGWKDGGTHYFINDRSQTTVWNMSRDAQAEYKHPTQKPVELFAKAIQNSTLGNDIVFDGFVGSGTSLVAAEQLNRICYGMEIEPKYVAVTLERMSMMGLEPKLISGA